MSAWPPAALVLTAGLGTRLRPLTDLRAKPVMPVGDDTLVGIILRRLAAQGIAEAVLNLHHLPHTITREVGDGSQYGVRVRYSWEQPVVLGSAGGPRHALPLVDGDTLLIVNGDTLCDIPLRALWDEHVASGALVTMGLMPHPAPGRYGGVTMDVPVPAPGLATPAEACPVLAAGVVTGFVPRTSIVPSVHFPGVQLVRREVLAGLPDNAPAESVGGVYPRLIASHPGAVRGVVFGARFDDVGTVDDYRRTCRAQAVDARGNVIDRTALVDPTARLRDCIVWPGAQVPAGCALHNVIVTGARPLPAGAALQDSIA
ncbi:mannose-1-phosphate guanylyltransferase [Luteitalea sp. TBR-22]|uniref:nucleotidyltransferase family protein n=1 Tax=Luteitalea sp. TBR-22 TaxID=2802971 RepID=UPI001AF5A261|nr:sugar phosphate nucleotidyltransferase [Luteitalea sp. TBR-22]BCS34521.1 mannose-1-phosphate guanylyltransferase [Luteitalea sp. TBR-22]